MPVSLEDWIATRDRNEFPRPSVDYAGRLRGIAEFLRQEVWPHAGPLALRANGYLTDHGEQHVKTVEARALALVELGGASGLSAYEAYLLALAIYIHDIGNVFGREGHEARIPEIMDGIRPLVGDAVEFRTVCGIAGAHSGLNDAGDRDTISALPANEPVMGQPVRKQLLAAVLRLADEIADDSSRAVRFLSQFQGVVPEASQIHHDYARSLHSVVVDRAHKSIDLFFQMNAADAMKEYARNDGSSTLLVDEIARRALKLFSELTYCMRFIRDVTSLERVSVRVEIYRAENSTEKLETLGYRLEEKGYRSFKSVTDGSICDAPPSDGAELCERLTPKLEGLMDGSE